MLPIIPTTKHEKSKKLSFFVPFVCTLKKFLCEALIFWSSKLKVCANLSMLVYLLLFKLMWLIMISTTRN